MNAKIKTFTLSCFLLFTAGNTFSQEVKPCIYSIDSVPAYKIINFEMCKAIDSVIFYAKECVYFSVLNNPYYINVWIGDTSWFSVTALPYSCTNLMRWDSRTKEEGYCNYKGHDVFICSFVPNYLNHFFESTGEKNNIYYHNSENLMDHVFIAYENVEIHFGYIDNKITVADDDISLCRDHQVHFFYMVKVGETWEGIAKKIGCSVEVLTNGFRDVDKPIPGYLIEVAYQFDDGKLIEVVRFQ